MSMMIQACKELVLLFLLARRGPRAHSFHSEARLRREEPFWSRCTGCTACVDTDACSRPAEQHGMVVRRLWPSSGLGCCLRTGTRLGCYGDGLAKPWRGAAREGAYSKRADPLHSEEFGGRKTLRNHWRVLRAPCAAGGGRMTPCARKK